MKWRLITELVEMLYCFVVIQNLFNDIALTTLLRPTVKRPMFVLGKCSLSFMLIAYIYVNQMSYSSILWLYKTCTLKEVIFGCTFAFSFMMRSISSAVVLNEDSKLLLFKCYIYPHNKNFVETVYKFHYVMLKNNNTIDL